jgi:hypothetical protein
MLGLPEKDPEPQSNTVTAYLVVLALYVAITLVVTYPLVLHLGTRVAQADEGWALDALQYVWTMWWTDRALFDLHTSPANLHWIQFPSGVYYPFLLAVNYVGFIALPLTRLASPAVAYNVLTLLAFALNGFAAYLFCLDLTKNRWGSFLGGLVFAFLPNRMAHAIGGHVDLISTYWFPLYGLLLLQMLRRPRMPLAVLCGVSLTLSTWVQVMYVPYFLIPLTAVIVAHISIVEGRSLRPALPALALMLGVAGLAAAPFLLPFLLESIGGGLSYLEEGGATAFSVDLLGFIAPSPTNPLLRHLGLIPPFSRRVVPENFVLTEVLSYLGLLPLMLAAWAVWRRSRRVAVWVILSVGAAILSLGPLLRLNGRLVTLEIDNLRSWVPLPYAFLARLPGLALGRTPGRFGMTVGFALAVLVAYGMTELLRCLNPRLRLGVAGVCGTLILIEYLVYWPMPTLALDAPDYLRRMSCSSEAGESGAVLNLPLARRRVNQLALYYQSIHEQPIVGGRVFRDLPDPLGLSEFLQSLHLDLPTLDVVPHVAPDSVAAIDRACGVSHVFLFKDCVGGADQVQAFLTTALSTPVSTAQGPIIYRVPPDPIDVKEFVYSLDRRWHAVEDWGGVPARWMSERAQLYVYAPTQQTDGQKGMLQFKALSLSVPQRLQIEVNGTALPPLVIGDHITYTTSSFRLQPGLNRIAFSALDGCTPFVGDPRCLGPARAAGAECNQYFQTERCLSVLFQNVRFLPEVSGPAGHPLDIGLGGCVHLLGYDLTLGSNGDGLLPGQSVSLSLYWQALIPLEEDYIVFVHLLGPDGDLVAQYDSPPLDGLYPTSEWVPGDIFTQQIVLQSPPDGPVGLHDLVAGLYTYPDIARLPVDSNRPFAQDELIWLQAVDVGR